MENILLVSDGNKFDLSIVDFACYIANLTRSRLTGVFIENIQGDEQPALKQLYALPYVETITASDLPENKQRIKSCEANEKLFAEACVNRSVNYQIHTNRKASVKDIIHESRFSDLIIIDPSTSFANETESTPSHFVKEVLAGAECPVVIAPFSFDAIEEIVFPYDGSKSSVFSIKQFAHIFPALKNKPTTVLQVDENEKLPGADAAEIKQLMATHFGKFKFEHLQGQAEDELFGYLLGKKNVFVVMGSYGRGLFSNLFKKSTADLLVKAINLPIFIAHNK